MKNHILLLHEKEDMFGKLFKKTDYKQLLDNGAVIIDVRSQGEFKGGSVPGSENIPVGNIPARIKQIKSLNTPVICVCASGMRSGAARAQLSAAGIEAYNGGPWTKMLKYVD